MTKSDQGIKARLFTYLQVGLKAGNGGGRDEATDAAAVDAQHRDELASAPMAKRDRQMWTRQASHRRRPGSIRSIWVKNESVGALEGITEAGFFFHWTIDRDR